MNLCMKLFLRTRRRQIAFMVFLLIFVLIWCISKQSTPTTTRTIEHFDSKIELRRQVELNLEEGLKEDKGSGCDIPKLDPFAKEVMQFNQNMGPIECPGKDWVKCYMSTCSVIPEILEEMPNVRCLYQDIIYVNDRSMFLAIPVAVDGNMTYDLYANDFVKVQCYGRQGFFGSIFGPKWSGYGVGFRSSVYPKTPPPGREKTVNVLILAFDSTSRNGFIRKMPKSYKVLTEELGATVLKGYNILGDGTTAALFPILSGRTELETVEARKSVPRSGHADQIPFIFYKLKKDGYRTAYFEDTPHLGTFQLRLNGFRNQPTDHYLRAFFTYAQQPHSEVPLRFCIGATPTFKIMLNITEQFMKLDGKRFIFTFIADISHDDFNYIGSADGPTADFLRGLKTQGILNNTLLIVMGDHGPRYAKLRNTLQGKLEERLPMMAIRIPEDLKTRRPDIQKNLELNADVLTTPHDIYATVLDAIDMRKNWIKHKIRGSDLKRGLTLFEQIPKNRSCSEAGIEPHWCTCLKWEDVPRSEPLYRRLAQALVEHINFITEAVRDKCVLRDLITIHWVMKKITNKDLLRFKCSADTDGYFNKFDVATNVTKNIYQVKATIGPGTGIYEAAITYLIDGDYFEVNTRDISRTNAYNDEPSCISDIYPHLNMFCFCHNILQRLKRPEKY